MFIYDRSSRLWICLKETYRGCSKKCIAIQVSIYMIALYRVSFFMSLCTRFLGSDCPVLVKAIEFSDDFAVAFRSKESRSQPLVASSERLEMIAIKKLLHHYEKAVQQPSKELPSTFLFHPIPRSCEEPLLPLSIRMASRT